MASERIFVQGGPSGVGLFVGLLAVVAIVVAVLWGTGALTVQRGPQDRVEVTFDPDRAEHAGDDVLDKTGKALERAGEKMQRQATKPNHEQPVR